jgi:glycosyltransferase involved in cell wall biosynthesis
MLRVLTLSTLFPDASRPNFGIFVERQTLAFASRPDVEVRVVAPLGVPPWPLSRLTRYRALGDLPERERWKGLWVHRPRFRNIPGTGGRFHAAMLARAVTPVLEQVRREFPFDLIAAEFFFPDGPAATALGKRFGVPVSIKARGSDIHRWTKRAAAGAQIRAAGRDADGMLAVSEAMRADMIALGMPGERIESIVTGVDLARFALRERDEAKAGLGISGPLIVSLGALIPLKGHDILIDAVSRLPGVSLWIAGEGPERPKLAARITRLGLGDRVRLLGAVPADQVPAVLAAADAMALASESEGLANAWLEALASGTPIVVPDVGGARQVLRDADAGRFAARTPGDFAAALADLLASPPERARVRAHAEPFTLAANSAALHAYYARLVAAHRGADRFVAAA